MKINLAVAAVGLVVLSPISARAQVYPVGFAITLTNPVVTVAPNASFDIFGFITNPNPFAILVDADSLAGPTNLDNTPSTNAVFPGITTFELNDAPVAVAAFGTSPIFDLFTIQALGQGTTFQGFYTQFDDTDMIQSNTATFTAFSTTPEFSTVAMMVAGSCGTLFRVARQRRARVRTA